VELLLSTLLYLHNVVYGAPSTALGVAWSLEIEIQFYVLVPALTLVFAIPNFLVRRAVLVGVTLAIMAAQAMFLQHDPRVALSLLAYLQFFLMGFLLADIFLVTFRNSARKVYWDVIAAVGWPALFVFLQSRALTHWLFPYLVFMLYCATFQSRWINRVFSNPWITAIGGMCYSIYLIHYEVISATGRFTKAIGRHLPDPLYLTMQFVLVGLAIVCVCSLYFVLLEKPCMRRDWLQRIWRYVREIVPAKQPRPSPTFAD
jgi:peptidoglycan/LPS O-acetylase OafA/YrhL